MTSAWIAGFAAAAALAFGRLQDPAPAPAPEVGDLPANAPDQAGAGAPPVAEPIGPIQAPEDVQAPLDLSLPVPREWLGEILAAVVRRHPRYARLDVLGKTRGGRDIVALVLGDLITGNPDERPGLALIGPARGVERSKDLTLAVADYLLQSLAPSETERILGSATLYLIPDLEPDAGWSEGPRPVDPLRNFPIGWRPESLVPGAGAVPLSEPESKALAVFLRQRKSLSLLLVAPEPEADALPFSGSKADADVLSDAAGAGAARVRPWSPARGNPAAFAWEALGIFPRSLEFAPESTAAAARRVVELAQSLPRLALPEPAVETLRPGLYKLDLWIENGGRLPTLSDLGAERRLAGEVELTVQGGSVLACAHRAGSEPFRVQGRGQNRYAIGQIAGESSAELCVVVEAPPASTLTLEVRSPRAGSAARTLKLP